MKKPFILALDDDLSVLKAIDRDLRSKFGRDYRILATESAQKALDLTRQLAARGDRVALFLVDQRMPQMSGTEFLREAMKIQPGARKVLLTAYADSNAAIDAINTLKLNHYLTKPWEPPEEKLFPVLKDLLEDWWAENPASFDGTYVIGSRWSPDTHRLKDFLAKSQVPYRWAEPEQIKDARVSAAMEQANSQLATTVDAVAVVFPDGTVLQKPTLDQVAEKLGLATQPKRDFYDVIIIGAGPAGLACALYCSTEGLKTILLEREAPGGQAGLSSRIENYLGFPSGLSGSDLARRGVAQVRRFGTEVLAPADAVGLQVDGEYRVVKLSNGHELVGHSVVIAAGVQWRQLHIPGIENLTGAGVYYGAATTEAPACKDEDIFVVGGANSAGQAAVHFAEVARSVTLLVRADALSRSMSFYLDERIRKTENISIVTNCEVAEVRGNGHLDSISIRHLDTGTIEERQASALFVFIGAEPHTEWLDGVLCRDSKGFIITGGNLSKDGKRPPGWPLERDPFLLETNIPGVFAVGDVRDGAVRRVANSVGEGSIVLYFVRQYLANK
jgi:thioredoxin reductase (NADPH)